MADLRHCEVRLLDHSETVHVDRVRDSKLFIGERSRESNPNSLQHVSTTRPPQSPQLHRPTHALFVIVAIVPSPLRAVNCELAIVETALCICIPRLIPLLRPVAACCLLHSTEQPQDSER